MYPCDLHEMNRLVTEHFSLQMSEGDSPLLCPVCQSDQQQVSFSCRPLLHRHIQAEHGYVQCGKCPVTVFVAPDSLQQHNTKNHPDRAALAEVGALKRKHEEDEEVSSNKRLAKSEEEDKNIDLNSLTDGEFSQPTKYSKDPLKGFFLQTILECAECEERPTKKFSSYNAWLVHLKSSHKSLSTLADYKAAHGDPSVVKFKHRCRVCNLEMFLNLTIIKRHLAVQHGTSVSQYLAQYREELLQEKRSRPLLAPQHTLEGWWEGCMYSCRLCHYSAQSQAAFESHLAQAHQISGQAEIEEKYLSLWGKLATLSRFHQCFVCSQVIRHEYRVIFHHLARHQTDLESYTKMYKEQLVAELQKKGMGYIVEREREISTAVSIEEYLEKHKKVPVSKEDNLMDNWYDCSQHHCKICDKSFWSNLRFHWHIKREHGIKSTKDYRRQHGDPEVKLRQHKCLVCHSLIKWEASRIRDHLKAHKNVEDKMSLKEYGEKFRESILAELKIVKCLDENQALSPTQQSLVMKEGHTLRGDTPYHGYSVEEWKELFGKKVNPDDKVECSLCQKVMNRHSYNRHMDRHHKGILNMRDLNRLKRKQLQLARTGVIKSLSELMKLAGGVAVCRGKGDNKEEVDIEEEEQESRLNMYKAGLSLDQIEKKMILINSGLTITKAESTEEEEEVVDKEYTKDPLDADDNDKNYSTYVVNQETGEIILLEESQAETILGGPENCQDDDSDLYDSETETGPLDGKVMEIDVTAEQSVGVEVEEDVKIIMLSEQYEGSGPEDNEEEVLQNVDNEDVQDKNNDNIVLLNDMENVQFVVADEGPAEVGEGSENKELVTGYLLVCEEGQVVVEPEPGAWHQLGDEAEYEPKQISRPRVEPSGGVSQGTVVCQWTKLAGDRQRVATNKLITPRLDRRLKEAARAADISSVLLYSRGGAGWRDVGCQVTPHRVNGVPTSREEEQQQAEAIRQFLREGRTLDRSCPGCGKMMSRQRNLVSHIQLIHGVEVEGTERDEHIARHTRENVRVQCQLCSRIVSRKSIKRHINLCHPSTHQQ